MMEERSDKDIISNFFLLEINREKRRNEKLGIKEFDESEFIKILEEQIERRKIYRDYEILYKEYCFHKYYLLSGSQVGNSRIFGKKYLNGEIIGFEFKRKFEFEELIYELNLPRYTNYIDYIKEGYDKYLNEDYTLDEFKIFNYNKNYLNNEEKENVISYSSKYITLRGKTVEFIKQLQNPLNPNDQNFNYNLLERWMYYCCWNRYTKEELIDLICHKNYPIFLKSTISLIENKKCKDYLNERYLIKEDLIEGLYKNFYFENWWELEIMKKHIEGYFVFNELQFDYDRICGKEIIKSIRILENEMRIDLGHKTIGSFYSEDVLFKTIKRTFGEKHKIISQGTPNWLKPQRLDIYFPELNIGIEYQGEQHFRPVDFGGKGREIAAKQFIENVKRDNIKKEKCLDNGCLLLEMKFDDDLNQFLSNLKKEIIKIERGY
jgi:hypothetical protein